MYIIKLLNTTSIGIWVTWKFNFIFCRTKQKRLSSVFDWKKIVVGDGFTVAEGSSSLMVCTVNVYIPPYGDVIS